MIMIEPMYDVIFVTTFVDDKHIYDLIHSVINSNDRLNVLLIILCQNGYTLDTKSSGFVNIRLICINEQVGLSAARNICLRYIRNNNIAYRYIMFPDDDSIFDKSFFSRFDKEVHGNTLIAVKGTQDKSTFFVKMPNKSVASKNDFAKAISVNMIVESEIINQVGYFDERLGVGCYYGAGEDNDYFLRCSTINSFAFSNNLWNYHPLQKRNIDLSVSQLKSRYKSYGRGVVYMLLKHSMTYQAVKMIFRGYFGAIVFLARLNVKMSYVYFIAANERLITFLKNYYRLC